MNRKYWSQRKGLTSKYDLQSLKKAVISIITEFENKGYYQEYFGYDCVDAGHVDGKAGIDIEAYVFRKTRRDIKWPIWNNLENVNEDVLFDIIEFMHDSISKPVDGYHHTYANCGFHYNTFDEISGRIEFRNQINEILNDYIDGYEINKYGEIAHLLSDGLRELTDASLPVEKNEIEKIQNKISRAVNKFKSRHSDFEDRKEAVRELADILEYIRPTVKTVLLKQDENDLFNIANNFSIRHHNDLQKSDYSPSWISWIFYLYLSTIHLCIRLREKENRPTTSSS